MDNIGKNSLLIVDDEEINLYVLHGMLSQNYTVYMAKGGASALELTDKYMPDLILLDIIMPDMNGFEVLTALKSRVENHMQSVNQIRAIERYSHDMQLTLTNRLEAIVNNYNGVIWSVEEFTGKQKV